MSIVLINNDSTSNNKLSTFLSLQQERKIIQINIKNNKYRDKLIQYVIKNADEIINDLFYTFIANCSMARASGVKSSKKKLICDFARDTYIDKEFLSCIKFFFGDIDNITTVGNTKIEMKAITYTINANSNIDVNHNFIFVISQAIPDIPFNLNKVLDYECGIYTVTKDSNGNKQINPSKSFISNSDPTEINRSLIILSVESDLGSKVYKKKYLIKYY